MPSRRKLAPVVGKDGISSGPSAREELSTVELDSTFARLLGLAEGQKVRRGLQSPLTLLTVQVGLFIHLDPPVAHTINIEPMTPEDWESTVYLNVALVYHVG